MADLFIPPYTLYTVLYQFSSCTRLAPPIAKISRILTYCTCRQHRCSTPPPCAAACRVRVPRRRRGRRLSAVCSLLSCQLGLDYLSSVDYPLSIVFFDSLSLPSTLHSTLPYSTLYRRRSTTNTPFVRYSFSTIILLQVLLYVLLKIRPWTWLWQPRNYFLRYRILPTGTSHATKSQVPKLQNPIQPRLPSPKPTPAKSSMLHNRHLLTLH